MCAPLAIAAIAALALAPSAEAASCLNLQEEVNNATAGAVLQLPAGICETNIVTSNTQSFTLEGTPPGTTLKAKTTTASILQISGGSTMLTDTLTNLTFTGTTSSDAVVISDANPAVTISDDTFVTNHGGTGGALSIGDGTAGSTAEPTRIVDDTFGGPVKETARSRAARSSSTRRPRWKSTATRLRATRCRRTTSGAP